MKGHEHESKIYVVSRASHSEQYGLDERRNDCGVREKSKKMQQLDVFFNNFSTCFGHHYAHLQENKTCVTACGVLRWFCWMWLVAVVGRCLVGCYCTVKFTVRLTMHGHRHLKKRFWISGGSEVLYSSVCATHTFGPGHSLVQELQKSLPPGLKRSQRAVVQLSAPNSRNWNAQNWTSTPLRVTFRVVSN